MGLTDPSKQRRDPQPGAHTRNGVSRVSPAWRLRTRSCSQDNELYRMGLDKSANGKWEVVRNRVPASLVNAMRAMGVESQRIRAQRRQSRHLARTRGPSKTSIKEEPETKDENVKIVDVAAKVKYVIDLTGSTDVCEEILIDVAAEVKYVIDLTDEAEVCEEILADVAAEVKDVIDLTDSTDVCEEILNLY